MLYDNPFRAEAFISGPFAGLCTPAEMAEILGIDDSTIRQAIRNGRLKIGHDCFQLGKQWILSENAWKTMYGNLSKLSILKVECRKTINAWHNNEIY